MRAAGRALSAIAVAIALPVAGAAVAGGALAGAAAPRPGNPAWYEPVDPVHIAGPIWYVGTQDLAAYLITTPAGHILLDGAMPGSGPTIEASIRKAGFDPHAIRQLLVTHAHCDHVGTLAYFKKLTGAPVAAMGPEEVLLKSGGRGDYLFADNKDFRFPRVTVDRVLKDGDTVTLGDVTLTARHTPGHTRGCATWIMTADEGGRSYAVVFAGSTSINPGTRFVVEPSYPGIADDYRKALDVLGSLHPDIFLAAHASFFDLAGRRGRVATGGAEAFVDPGLYRERLADQRRSLDEAIAQERQAAAAAGANGTTGASLGGTAWRLVRFEGGDGSVILPDDPAKYTVEFGADGSVAVRLDCNRGRGAWKTPGAGQIELGPMALTRAMCAPGSMHDQVVKSWGFIRSYVLKDGRLYLSLMADGGVYEFEPI